MKYLTPNELKIVAIINAAIIALAVWAMLLIVNGG